MFAAQEVLLVIGHQMFDNVHIRRQNPSPSGERFAIVWSIHVAAQYLDMYVHTYALMYICTVHTHILVSW